MENNGNQWKTMAISVKQWQPMAISVKQWQPMANNGKQWQTNNGRLALTPFNVPPGSEASATAAWPPKPTWKARTVGPTT